MATKYGRIAHELREQIASGDYPPGSKLPTIPELMATYDAARDTIRDALGLLGREGLTITRSGAGTFVRDVSPVALEYRGGIARPWIEQVGGGGVDMVVQAGWSVADADVAARLDLAPGARVVYRIRHFALGGEKAMVSEQWIPEAIVQAAAAAGLGDLSSVHRPDGNGRNLFQLFAAAGFAPTEITETISARPPSPEELDALPIPAGVPVLVTLRVTRDVNRQPLETSVNVAPADRKTATFVIPVSY